MTQPAAAITALPDDKTLQELEGHVTTITVAHRLATVRHADQLVYLVRGQIVARGSFDERVASASPELRDLVMLCRHRLLQLLEQSQVRARGRHCDCPRSRQ